jgi:hypothetical protein
MGSPSSFFGPGTFFWHLSLLISTRGLLISRAGIVFGFLRAPDSAVEGEAQGKAQAFRSERNRPVPLSAVADIGAMSGVLKRCERSAKNTLKHYGSMRSLLQAHASPSRSHTIELQNPG